MVLSLDEGFSEPESPLNLIKHVALAIYFAACVLLDKFPEMLEFLHAQVGVFLQDIDEDLGLLVVVCVAFDSVGEEAISYRLENLMVFDLLFSHRLISFSCLPLLLVSINIIIIKIIEIRS